MPATSTQAMSIEEVFAKHHDKIVEKRLAMETALTARGEIERAVRAKGLRKAQLFLQIARETGEDGKPLYRNAEERDAALTIRMESDEVYAGELDLELKAREKLGRADIDIATMADLIKHDNNVELMLVHRE